MSNCNEWDQQSHRQVKVKGRVAYQIGGKRIVLTVFHFSAGLPNSLKKTSKYSKGSSAARAIRISLALGMTGWREGLTHVLAGGRRALTREG
jgi:hypothetical protein